jgi:hypothetical protein
MTTEDRNGLGDNMEEMVRRVKECSGSQVDVS